jgi:tetratricopeptide (TPR) repeat protein
MDFLAAGPWCLYHARRYDDAIAQYRSTLGIDPNFSLAHCTLGMALAQKQNIARTYALSGKRSEAKKLVAELEESAKTQYVPAMYVAAIYAALGNGERSI